MYVVYDQYQYGISRQDQNKGSTKIIDCEFFPNGGPLPPLKAPHKKNTKYGIQ